MLLLKISSLSLSQAKLEEADFELVGSDSYAARFGETIMNLGDIDDDGYPGTVCLTDTSMFEYGSFINHFSF